MEEAYYRTRQTRLERAKMDAALDPSGIPNISIIQAPTTPRRPDGQ